MNCISWFSTLPPVEGAGGRSIYTGGELFIKQGWQKLIVDN
jgi:hypothetical protein